MIVQKENEKHKKKIRALRKASIYGSDAIVDVIAGLGIKVVVANIGSTFRGLWESLVNYEGGKSITCVSACHEEIAVAMAHGYAKASGKPIVALVHDVVGLQHASMAIYNAWCDAVPLIVIGAEGPIDPARRRPWIDWIHTANIPNTLVRDFVKWDAFPNTIQGACQSLLISYKMAMSAPRGPTYICLDSTYLEEKANLDRATKAGLENRSVNTDVSAETDALRRISGMLCEAEHPLIVAGRTGRDPEAVNQLVKLAETCGASVIDTGESFAFPNTHYLDATGMDQEIARADFILCLDSPMQLRVLSRKSKLQGKKLLTRKSEVALATIGLENIAGHAWSDHDHVLIPGMLSVSGDAAKSIQVLADYCSDQLNSRDRNQSKQIKERLEIAQTRYKNQRREWQKEAERRWNDIPISTARLAAEVWEAIKGSSWVIGNGLLSGWVRRLWKMEKPGCYLGS
ncbi:MAG: thiamine pyrophosphate-binding protein, partial [Nitrososphaerales archaeon]